MASMALWMWLLHPSMRTLSAKGQKRTSKRIIEFVRLLPRTRT